MKMQEYIYHFNDRCAPYRNFIWDL